MFRALFHVQSFSSLWADYLALGAGLQTSQEFTYVLFDDKILNVHSQPPATACLFYTYILMLIAPC